MSADRERLQDLNMAEAAGRDTPPNLTARILKAVERDLLQDAATPISGIHSVPANVRPPQGRRMTTSVRPARKRNWQGAGFVIVACLLIAASLIGFVLSKQSHEKTPDPAPSMAEDVHVPNTAEDDKRQPETDAPDTTPEPEADLREQKPPQPEDDDPPAVAKETPEPEPKDPKNPDVVKEPDPAPKPEPESAPKPEPKADDVVSKPEDDSTTTSPKPEPVVVATIAATDKFRVRNAVDDKWERAEKTGLLTRDGPSFSIPSGMMVQGDNLAITLSNGALVFAKGELAMHTSDAGLRIELIDDDLYVDNVGATSGLRVIKEHLEIGVSDGAALIESNNSRLRMFCLDGKITAAGETVSAGQLATLSGRGLSSIDQARESDYRHRMIQAIPSRSMLREDFDSDRPTGLRPENDLLRLPAEELGAEQDSGVAFGSGKDAAVSYALGAPRTLLRGDVIRVRFRQTGATGLILQCWNPDKKDNYGIDLPAGEEGEWQVVEVELHQMQDRKTNSAGAIPTECWDNISLHARGADTTVELDWFEFVRMARYSND